MWYSTIVTDQREQHADLQIHAVKGIGVVLESVIKLVQLDAADQLTFAAFATS